jgi:hypothetical protein
MATFYSNDEAYNKEIAISAAYTVLASDNGAVYTLDAAGGAAVTLPTLAKGLRYKFVVASAFASTNWVVSSSEGDNINGLVADMGTTPAVVLASGEDQINFVATAESIGDYVEFIADVDNSQWIVNGMCGVNGGITATDPS